jgi:hypothetical protein
VVVKNFLFPYYFTVNSHVKYSLTYMIKFYDYENVSRHSETALLASEIFKHDAIRK